MLASRSLFNFRVDRVWKLTNTYISGNSLCCDLSYNLKMMGGSKDTQNSRYGNKKLKRMNLSWRPVCSQVNAYGECSEKDVKVVQVDGNQVNVSHYSTSISVASVQDIDMESEEVSELTESTTISRVSLDKDADRSMRESIQSMEKHSVSVEVGASLMRFIKGKGGSMQKKIEEEHGIKIIFPSSRMEDSVIIEGSSVECVRGAVERIQTFLDEVVQSPYLDYSHFVSLPLAIHPELVEKLVHFQNSILGVSDSMPDGNRENNSTEGRSENEDKQQEKGLNVAVELQAGSNNDEHARVKITDIPLTSYAPKASNFSTLSDLGIDKSIFNKPKTFHLTVLMLKLWNKERVNAAAEVLKSVSTKVLEALDGQPISVRLKGLECMRGSLKSARVLYASVEEIGGENRLLRACQIIINAYAEAGLVLEKDRNQRLKLHATMMNASHRKSKGRRKFDSFDARGIVEQYGSEEWGEYPIREAHLSQRFVFDENGYYHCCAILPFPENMQVE